MSIYPKLEFLNLNSFLSDLETKSGVVECGVAVQGEAAAYAEVWEWGNARQTKKGPRTVMGINPDGESVWLSSQAPNGYIRVNLDKYLDIVKIQLEQLALDGDTVMDLQEELKKTEVKIMEQIIEVLQDTAPVDTGQLRSSFVVVQDGDDLLESDKAGTIESRFNRVLNIGERK